MNTQRNPILPTALTLQATPEQLMVWREEVVRAIDELHRSVYDDISGVNAIGAGTIANYLQVEATTAACYVALLEGATGFLAVKTDAGITYNATTNILTVSGSISSNLTGNVTGNCSGTAATVTGAAQASITSLGTLTTLTVDNITINGSSITGISDANTVMTAYAGRAIAVESVTFDGGVVAGITTLTTSDNVAIGTTDMDGTPAIGRLVVKGSTADGTTNCLVLRDSAEANVLTVDTDGNIIATKLTASVTGNVTGTATGLTAGALTNAMLSTAAGEVGAAWTSYTPNWSSNGGTFATTSTTITTNTFYWIQIGKVVFFTLNLVINAIGTASTQLIFSLPVSAAHICAVSGFSWTAAKTLMAFVNGASGYFQYYDAVFPGASGNSYYISGSYEVA